MQRLRTFLHSRYLLAQMVVILALCFRLAVPAGFMIATVEGDLTVILCNSASNISDNNINTGHSAAQRMAKAQTDGQSGKMDTVAREGKVCAFSALGYSLLGGADPVQLALEFAFIVSLGFVAFILPAPLDKVWLRPPLRGPPVLI